MRWIDHRLISGYMKLSTQRSTGGGKNGRRGGMVIQRRRLPHGGGRNSFFYKPLGSQDSKTAKSNMLR